MQQLKIFIDLARYRILTWLMIYSAAEACTGYAHKHKATALLDHQRSSGVTWVTQMKQGFILKELILKAINF